MPVERAYVKNNDLDGRILSLDSDILAYMGSDWDSEDAKTKARYYAKLSPDDMDSYPGDSVIESLPQNSENHLTKNQHWSGYIWIA